MDSQIGKHRESASVMGVISNLLLITTTLRNFTKGENRDFSAFRFSLHLMLEHALSNLIVCLMILQKLQTKVA